MNSNRTDNTDNRKADANTAETVEERHRRELDQAFHDAAELFRRASRDDDPDWE